MRTVTALLLTAVMIIFTGCSRECEIRDRAFVQSIGIENTDGRFEVALRLFEDDRSFTGNGETFDEAVADAERAQVKRFYTGHTELIVLRETGSKVLLENFVNEDISLDCHVLYDSAPVSFVSDSDTSALTVAAAASGRNICDILNQK